MECQVIMSSHKLTRTEIHRLYRLLFFAELELDELCKQQPNNSELYLLLNDILAMQDTIISATPVPVPLGKGKAKNVAS